MYRENNKGRKSGTKNCIFLKRMSFRATQVEKVESLGKMRGGRSAGAGAGAGRGGFRAAHTRCSYVHRSFTLFHDRWTLLNSYQTKVDIFNLEFIEN